MIKRDYKISFNQTTNSAFQGNLFTNMLDRTTSTKPLYYYPIVKDTYEDLRKLIETIPNGSYVGIDFEFGRNYYPTEVGIAYGNTTVGLKWTKPLIRLIEKLRVEKRCQLVAFSTIEADKEVYEKVLGFQTPLSNWEDAMKLHYFCSNDLTQEAGGKTRDTESLGLMNLWAATNLILTIPNWKLCWDRDCDGWYCPVHDRVAYCAVDAWAGLQVFLHCKKKLTTHGFPWELYRETLELEEYFLEISRRGIKINKTRVRELEDGYDETKANLFGYYNFDCIPPFNPRSSLQILEFFRSFNIKLQSTDIQEISKKLATYNDRYNFEDVMEWAELDEDEEKLLPPPIFWLRRLWLFKRAGKGLDGWFGEQYLDSDSLAHPRFFLTSTSTSRVACGDPNFMNIPRIGFGSEARDAIIPRHKDLIFVKSDYGQLELRKVCWNKGLDLGRESAWVGLLKLLGPVFEPIANELGNKPKDVLKTFVYGYIYGEGLTLIPEGEIRSPRNRSMIQAGALLFDPTWKFEGNYVTFSGVNLALRLFKSKEYSARAKALELQRVFSEKIPVIKAWQKEVCAFIESHPYTKTSTGRFMYLYADSKRKIKRSLSYDGQGGGADFVTESMLWFKRNCRNEPFWPVLMVHDELDWEIDRGKVKSSVKRITEIMECAKKRLPGFSCPTESKQGISLWPKMMTLIE